MRQNPLSHAFNKNFTPKWKKIYEKFHIKFMQMKKRKEEKTKERICKALSEIYTLRNFSVAHFCSFLSLSIPNKIFSVSKETKIYFSVRFENYMQVSE